MSSKFAWLPYKTTDSIGLPQIVVGLPNVNGRDRFHEIGSEADSPQAENNRQVARDTQ
jgi:hypothetical protein